MLFVIAAPLIAFVAGRYTAPEARATPIVTVKREVVARAVPVEPVHCPTLPADVGEDVDKDDEDDPDAIDVENTEAVRLLEQESKRLAMLETGLGVRGGLRGQVRDTRTGESLVGVTVVASAGPGSQTAITDEHGYYEIMGLEPASYVVTLYYVDSTVEHRDIVVSSSKVTPLFAKIDSSAQPQQITINTHEGITIDTNYVKDIPVSGRVFESALSADPCAIVDNEGVTLDGVSDGEGITFSGGTTLENTYVIE